MLTLRLLLHVGAGTSPTATTIVMMTEALTRYG